MQDADPVKRVTTLTDEIEAQLVDGLLSDQNIPHVMRTYRDSAYDGLFQSQAVWGHVEAPLSFHERVRGVIEELRRRVRGAGNE